MSTAFNLQPLSPGIYIIKLDYEKGVRYTRFIVD
ncbi:T9SS type A sorting domain-containing protein [Ohtaekwangia sp.]